jgi:hypothetical protein
MTSAVPATKRVHADDYCSSWVAVGAFLVTALLGTSLFTQNVARQAILTLPITDTPSWMDLSRTYNTWFSGAVPGQETPLAGVIAAATSGFSAPFDDTFTYNYDTLYACNGPSGIFENCTFGRYSTLSVCSACSNITYQIHVQGDVASLPDDSLTLASTAIVNITSDTEYPDPVRLPGIGPLIAHYRALAWGFGTNSTPEATECAAYWCVNEYNSSTVSFGFAESLQNSFTNLSMAARTAYNQSSNITLIPPTCASGSTTMVGEANCTFTVQAEAHQALQNFLTKGVFGAPPFLSGYQATINNDTSRWETTSIAAQMLGDPCAYPSFYQPEDTCDTLLYQNLGAAFISMSTFLSHAVRTQFSTGYFRSFGTAYITGYYFHIR